MPSEIVVGAPPRMADMTWPEVLAAVNQGSGVILPVGALEQHGPHLPLRVDALLAETLADAVAARTRCIVAPTIAYGYRSRPQLGGGQSFVGTTSLSGASLIAQVRDVLCEFQRHGFKRICVLNWHTENSNFLYEAACLALEASAATKSKFLVIEAPFDELPSQLMDLLFEDDEFPGWGLEHASILETSLMQHLHPSLVRTELIEDGAVGRRVSYEVLPLDSELTSPNGVLWKATRASAQKGAHVWAQIVKLNVDAVLRELPPTGQS